MWSELAAGTHIFGLSKRCIITVITHLAKDEFPAD